ncbi:MAG: T9SS type A sorting domain-containing protein [Bacteroidetes bacterium]|nr:T9SS type A sorting domain-containing protein [Bacteroidota bacterium]
MKTNYAIVILIAAVVTVAGYSGAAGQNANANQNAFNNSSAITVAPNPVHNELIVHFNNGNLGLTEIMIYDNSGQVFLTVVAGKISHPGNAHYSIATFPPGLYNLIYTSEIGSGNVPFVKQ